ncbi:hypothetical protein F5050DRAFT_1716284 [Lentinula boryana]|uniref:Uncharacterized protein n=1 Tax=Lentinula boryana TaxID=40481 RepID=A0ABQ8PXR3_9AGAR|nr:hypothetical protein F5050DRAFT_1716284 [Lentinula boryana]
MSTTSTTTETTQQRRERLLHVQEERQRLREAEAARQAAEFEEEMKCLEEEAAREAELAAEKKRLEEEKMAEQARRAEEQCREAERIAWDRARALKRLEEERKKEKEANSRVVDEAAKCRELAAAAALRRSLPQPSQPASGSQPHTKKVIKLPSKVRDDSEELTEEEEELPTPQGVKRKMMTVMIGSAPDPDDGSNPASGDDGDGPASPSPSPSNARSPCNRWSGENAAHRSRVKQGKLEDELYQGPTRRVTERRIGMEQMERFAEHNREVAR